MSLLHLALPDWETACPARQDKTHCTCWYDGGKCCSCGDGAKIENGSTVRGPHPVFGGLEGDMKA